MQLPLTRRTTQLDHTSFLQHQGTGGTPQKSAGQIAKVRLMAHQTKPSIPRRQQRFKGASRLKAIVNREL